jgi:hypothetical protein
MTEKEIENSILMHLEMRGDCIAWKNQSVGIFDPKRKVYRKSRNRFHKNGVSDIICMLHDGPVIFLEVKTQYGRQSENQKQFQKDCEDMGQIYRIVKSIEDVETIFREIEQGIL